MRAGRREEFAHFPRYAQAAERGELPDPCSEATFRHCKLDRAALHGAVPREWRRFCGGLLATRQQKIVPHLGALSAQGHRAWRFGAHGLVVRWAFDDGRALEMAVNLARAPLRLDTAAAPPPMTAAVVEHGWAVGVARRHDERGLAERALARSKAQAATPSWQVDRQHERARGRPRRRVTGCCLRVEGHAHDLRRRARRQRSEAYWRAAPSRSTITGGSGADGGGSSACASRSCSAASGTRRVRPAVFVLEANTSAGAACAPRCRLASAARAGEQVLGRLVVRHGLPQCHTPAQAPSMSPPVSPSEYTSEAVIGGGAIWNIQRPGVRGARARPTACAPASARPRSNAAAHDQAVRAEPPGAVVLRRSVRSVSRHYLLLPRGQRPAGEAPPLARHRAVQRRAVELASARNVASCAGRAVAALGRLGVAREVRRTPGCRPRRTGARAARRRSRRSRRKGVLRAVLLAHEQQRQRRREQQRSAARSRSASGGAARQPLAEGAVADLVVVLQEVDERAGGGRCAARLAARRAARDAATARPGRRSPRPGARQRAATGSSA